MNLPQMYYMGYEEIFDRFTDSYVREFGERKYYAIVNKIMNSNKISKLITVSKQKGLPPTSNDYLYCLNEIPYFIFSRGQTQAVGALIALQRWNDEVNSQANMLNVEELKFRAIKILEESKITFF